MAKSLSTYVLSRCAPSPPHPPNLYPRHHRRTLRTHRNPNSPPPKHAGNTEIPEGIEMKMHLFRNEALENTEVGEWTLRTEGKEGYIGRERGVY
jgi:hypothetical protein